MSSLHPGLVLGCKGRGLFALHTPLYTIITTPYRKATRTNLASSTFLAHCSAFWRASNLRLFLYLLAYPRPFFLRFFVLVFGLFYLFVHGKRSFEIPPSDNEIHASACFMFTLIRMWDAAGFGQLLMWLDMCSMSWERDMMFGFQFIAMQRFGSREYWVWWKPCTFLLRLARDVEWIGGI